MISFSDIAFIYVGPHHQNISAILFLWPGHVIVWCSVFKYTFPFVYDTIHFLFLYKDNIFISAADYDETGSGAAAADSRQRRQSGDEQEDDIVDSSGAPPPPTADAVSGESKAQIFAIMLDKVTQKVTYEGENCLPWSINLHQRSKFTQS